uniref:Uncharacterized protein n=1 Tax=Rhizophora mucronata TaxID=61149 RepID=A0A2P2QHH1_RHIMU
MLFTLDAIFWSYNFLLVILHFLHFPCCSWFPVFLFILQFDLLYAIITPMLYVCS